MAGIGSAFSVKLDDRQLERKITRIVKELDKTSDKTAMDLAEKGKWIAKFLSPKWSGRTSDFIIARKSPVKGESKIIARNPTADRPNFNLVEWMHRTNGKLNGKKHIYSGDPRFMFTTRIELNRIKRQVAKGNFNKINIK